MDKALLAKLPEIQQRLFVLFASYKDFNSFGNKAWAISQNMTSLDSIEAIHDIIHIYGGLNGHMTYVPLSSFDPLFFIHHVTMDRLIAMWQVLNPTAWIVPMAAGETSYTTLKGDIQTSKTPLTPFYIFEDTFWDSDMARYTTTFGYDYADTDPTVVIGEPHVASLARKITAWYGAVAGPRDMGNGFRTAGARAWYTEWLINAHVKAGALDGPFSLHFYLENEPVGTIDFFTMGKARSKVSGSLPLTSVVRHLRQEDVESHLREALSLRVRKADGRTEVPANAVDSLHVVVSSAKVKAARDGQLPRWEPPAMRFELVV